MIDKIYNYIRLGFVILIIGAVFHFIFKGLKIFNSYITSKDYQTSIIYKPQSEKPPQIITKWKILKVEVPAETVYDTVYYPSEYKPTHLINSVIQSHNKLTVKTSICGTNIGKKYIFPYHHKQTDGFNLRMVGERVYFTKHLNWLDWDKLLMTYTYSDMKKVGLESSFYFPQVRVWIRPYINWEVGNKNWEGGIKGAILIW